MKLKELLLFFEKNQGKTIKEKELTKWINKKNKKKIKEGYREFEILISDFLNLNLIQKENKKIKIKKPFLVECKISLSPSGIAFAMPKFLFFPNEFPKDIFIPPNKTKGALLGDYAFVRLIDKKKDRFEGEVVSIVKRGREFYRMQILEIFNEYALGKLLDVPCSLSVVIDLSDLSEESKKKIQINSKVIIKLSGKYKNFKNARFFEGVFIRFEDQTEFDLDLDRILIKYNLNPYYPKYEYNHIDPKDPSSVPDWKSRKDLRSLYSITIDGEDAKDFDDAISIEEISGNKIKLYVHIADVSYYVPQNSLLDQEALERGTSYYLANRVIPMLPFELSENLCSLKEGENRLTVTVEMILNKENGKILKYDFYRSIINVNKRYTYEIAETLIDSKQDHTLNLLWNIAQKQRQLRLSMGRIDLEFPESKFVYDKNNKIIEIRKRERLKSAMLIEECMLSANICVAEFLYKKKVPTLFRIHEPMDIDKLETLNAFFKVYNVKNVLEKVENKEIQKALERIQKKGDKEYKIFSFLLLRSFMQARYSPESVGHWGLGFKHYCHFTSPIRRYPDFVVHRVLMSVLNKKKAPYTLEEIFELAIKTSEAERNAMEAERDMWKLKLIRYIENTNQKIFYGFITGVRSDAVYLELEDFPVDGIVSASHLTNELELILPDPFSVYIKKLARPAFLGERWKLELEKVDIEGLKLYFKPLFS
ncbi:MAG: ribonuclease R family protein [Leptonema sp. (in: bacteria)]